MGGVDAEHVLGGMPSTTHHPLLFHKEYTGFRVSRGCRFSCWSVVHKEEEEHIWLEKGEQYVIQMKSVVEG
jgi:hypothetical protein